MSNLALALTELAAIMLAVAGCRTQLQSRVVRLELSSSPVLWRLSVNGTTPLEKPFSNSALIQWLNDLHLAQGDVILLAVPRVGEDARDKVLLDWASSSCRTNRVAVYLVVEPFLGVDMFSVRAYHWVAPYDDPFDLADAFFFCEGRPIGRGASGFAAMLDGIAHDRPKRILVLGSRFDMGRAFPPDPTPYENQGQRLDEVLRAAGTDLIRLSPMP